MEYLSAKILSIKNIGKMIISCGEYNFLDELYPNRPSFCDDKIGEFNDPIYNLDEFSEHDWEPLIIGHKEMSSFKSEDSVLIAFNNIIIKQQTCRFMMSSNNIS